MQRIDWWDQENVQNFEVQNGNDKEMSRFFWENWEDQNRQCKFY